MFFVQKWALPTLVSGLLVINPVVAAAEAIQHLYVAAEEQQLRLDQPTRLLVLPQQTYTELTIELTAAGRLEAITPALAWHSTLVLPQASRDYQINFNPRKAQVELWDAEQQRVALWPVNAQGQTPLVMDAEAASYRIQVDSVDLQARWHCLSCETELPLAPPAYEDGNLNAYLATYLSSQPDDQPSALAINSQGLVWVAGAFSDSPHAEQTLTLLGADQQSPGRLLGINPVTRQVEQLTHLGDKIHALAVHPQDDSLVVWGDFGLVRLDAKGQKLLWQQPASELPSAGQAAQYSSGLRLAQGSQGELALLGNRRDGNGSHGWVQLRAASGELLHDWTLPRSDIGGGTYNDRWEDIALDSDSQGFFVTGFTQRCSNYQSPFILAYDYTQGTAEKQWRSFTLWCSGAQNSNLTADSRGKRLVYSAEAGVLLFSGKADGGNNLFTRSALDHQQSQPNNIQIDRWNEGAGSGSGSFAYFAELNPQSGEVVRGQFQYSSVGVNQARSFEVQALARTARGDILIGGYSHSLLPERDQLSINTQPLGEPVAREVALLGVSADFTRRTLIASLTAQEEGAAGEITALATGQNRQAAIGRTQGNIITDQILPGSVQQGGGTFLLVW